MKRFHLLTVLSVLIFIAVSCESTDIQEEATQEPEPIVPVEIPELSSVDAAYHDAIKGIEDGSTISKDTFENDKSIILSIMDELDVIMANRDYEKWTTYIEPSSLTYWKNPAHLRKASAMLPRKGIILKNLDDYFRNVFIPSRKGSVVDQIRYINDVSVKAVHVENDGTAVVYYNFKRINNKWLIELPNID